MPEPQITILRRKQMEARTGLSRSSIYAKLHHVPGKSSYFDPSFPKPIRLGPQAVGWIESEVNAWLAAQAAKRASDQ